MATRTVFRAEKIPGGADYASWREIIDGDEVIVVVYNPETVAWLTSRPETAGVASELCALVLNEQLSPPGRRLRLVS